MVSGQYQEWERECREQGIPGTGHPNGDAGCPHQKVRREGKQKTKAEKTPFTRQAQVSFFSFLRSLPPLFLLLFLCLCSFCQFSVSSFLLRHHFAVVVLVVSTFLEAAFLSPVSFAYFKHERPTTPQVKQHQQ